MSPSQQRSERDGRKQGLGGVQRLLLFAIVGVLVLSVVARAFVGAGSSSDPDPSGMEPAPAGASGLVSGGPGLGLPGPDGTPGTGVQGEAAPEPGSLEALLPFFTETSFFALIGFALGYATRKVVKVLLIVVAVFFAGLQAMVYAGVAEVDWGQAIELLNGLILNVQQEQTLTEILKAKVPAFGGLAGGYLVGFRRG